MAVTDNTIVRFGNLKETVSQALAKMDIKDAATLKSAKDYTDEEIGKITIPEVPEYSISKVTAEDGYIASYKLMKGAEQVGETINIPKDYLVKKVEIKVATAGAPVETYKDGDKYIDFTVNTVEGDGNESHLYLLVTELAQTYTGGAGIVLSASNEISIVIQDGTKDLGGITKEDYNTFKAGAEKAGTNETAITAIQNELAEEITTDDITALFVD